MKKVLLTMFLIGVFQLIPYAEDSRVSLFKTEIPVQASKFLSAVEGNSLKVVANPDLSAGQCILRRKLTTDEYCLLLGKLTNTNNQELLPIDLSSDIALDTIIRLKFYDNEDSSSIHEISDVYFTKFGTIYVGGTTHISYLYHAQWYTFKADLNASSAQEQFVTEDRAKKKTTKIFLWVLGGLLAICALTIIIGASISPG